MSTPPRTLQLGFGLATFWCSALIFWVEPLTGKQLLPLLGGAPAVWNVCLLFFQVALLAGYALAHGLTRLRNAYAQAAVFLAVAVAGALLLPVQFDHAPGDAAPTAWLFGQLTLELMLPFIALAAAAPLLQHWYSRTATSSAEDPYFLYAGSNAGSLIALLAFPVLLEPSLTIRAQSTIWTVLFCAGTLLTALASTAARRAAPAAAAAEPATKPLLHDVLYWMLLAAVPSSLLMGFTTYLTADLAPVPLLWVIPLALYLLTFIVAFGWLRDGLPGWYGKVIVMLVVAWCMLYRLMATEPLLLLVLIHVVVFTLLALGSHARLAMRRPAAAHLTSFYLAVAAGGAVGGVFNAIVAPALFDSYAEYPLAVLAAVWLNLRERGERVDGRRDLLPAFGVVVMIALLLLAPLPDGPIDALAPVALPVAAAYLLSRRALPFTLALAAVLFSLRFDDARGFQVLHRERNFYGLLRVTMDESGRYRELRHGTTLHGALDTQQPEGSEPLSYYSIGSPIAQVIRERQQQTSGMSVGVVGLGIGTLAWYAQPREQWTFYEINPAVITLAQDPRRFDFLARSQGAIRVVEGDARLELRDAPDASFDILVLDAFTSDAIPLHILTQEAVGLYVQKLKPDGVLAFHISNRYLDLAPAIAATGGVHGLHAWLRSQMVAPDVQQRMVASSDWLVLARTPAHFTASADDRWRELNTAFMRPWTDDYSNIWSVFVR